MGYRCPKWIKRRSALCGKGKHIPQQVGHDQIDEVDQKLHPSVVDVAEKQSMTGARMLMPPAVLTTPDRESSRSLKKLCFNPGTMVSPLSFLVTSLFPTTLTEPLLLLLHFKRHSPPRTPTLLGCIGNCPKHFRLPVVVCRRHSANTRIFRPSGKHNVT